MKDLFFAQNGVHVNGYIIQYNTLYRSTLRNKLPALIKPCQKRKKKTMSFRKPITTFGGLVWWKNIKQNEYFIMQKHAVGLPIWPYRYRILLRESRLEIANSNDQNEIELDWEYLKSNAVPQLNEKIDLGKPEVGKAALEIVIKLISSKL